MKLFLTVATLVISMSSAYAEDREFVFMELPPELQKYAYKSFCNEPSLNLNCKLDYEEYVGKTAKIEISENKKYGYYKVTLQDGDIKWFFITLKDDNNLPKINLSNLMWKDEYDSKYSIVGKPIVPNSPIIINSMSSDGSYIIKDYEPFNSEELNAIIPILKKLPPELHDKFVKLASDMLINYDQFKEEYVFNSAPYLFKNRSPLFSLEIHTNLKNSHLIQQIQYNDDDWLFVNNYIFLIGSEKIVSMPHEFSRNNSAGKVWEYERKIVDKKSKEIINKIIENNGLKIRFQGKQNFADFTLNNIELMAIKNILEISKKIDQHIISKK